MRRYCGGLVIDLKSVPDRNKGVRCWAARVSLYTGERGPGVPTIRVDFEQSGQVDGLEKPPTKEGVDLAAAEAVRKAVVIAHRWKVVPVECPRCHGTGKVDGPDLSGIPPASECTETDGYIIRRKK